MLDYQVRAPTPRHRTHPQHPTSRTLLPAGVGLACKLCAGEAPFSPPPCLLQKFVSKELRPHSPQVPSPSRSLSHFLTASLAQPPQFKLDPRLARLLGLHTQSRSAIVQALWQYVKTNRLQDSHDKEYINGDKYFQQVPSPPSLGPRGGEGPLLSNTTLPP